MKLLNSKECILAIYDLVISSDVNLSVFVGMSDDGTREIATGLNNQYSSFFLIDNPTQLTPSKFNIGIQALKFDLLQIVGARYIFK